MMSEQELEEIEDKENSTEHPLIGAGVSKQDNCLPLTKMSSSFVTSSLTKAIFSSSWCASSTPSTKLS